MPVQRKKSVSRRAMVQTKGKDAIALLKQDHVTVKKLLKQLESAEDSGTREELLEKVEIEIKIHTTIEEEIFYPAFREATKTEKEEKMYFEAMEEHHVVDLVMPEIKGTDADDETFPAKVKVLKDLIEHHAEEEEEGVMFPKAQRLLGAEELRTLGQQMQERKQELMDEYGVETAPPRTRRRRAA